MGTYCLFYRRFYQIFNQEKVKGGHIADGIIAANGNYLSDRGDRQRNEL